MKNNIYRTIFAFADAVNKAAQNISKATHNSSKSLLSAAAFLAFFTTAEAQVGNPYIHDPSTLAECDGKYYTFGTGQGGLISEDGGYTWQPGAERPGGGAAPDVLKIGDRYLVAYSATGGGLGGTHRGQVLTMWNKTLDPKSPDFKYSEPQVVAWSEDGDDCDAIDPGLLLDPTTGRLWLSYGTYFGYIRLVELDPKTGKRVEGNEAINVAIDCEATDLIYRDGWYYLLGTHGTCCDGVNSTYNIVCGRSRDIRGPYLDNTGRSMLQGGGKMVIKAHDRVAGPGHFGRTILEEGVEKMSCHFEGDYDRSGYSVLGIRPLLWHNGWPVAGKVMREGRYEISSERHGYSLEIAVDFKRVETERRRWHQANSDDDIKPIPMQSLADVESGWPKGTVGVRNGDYMARPHQQWDITAVEGVGGCMGQPYYKITISGTNRTLTATADGEVVAEPAFTGKDEQLWQIDQLTDGTYRIMPKAVPGRKDKLCLSSIADSTPSLIVFDFSSDNCKWSLERLGDASEAATTTSPLPDPLAFNDGQRRATTQAQWSERRAEIAEQIQQLEIGTIPSVDRKDIKAWMDGDTIFVNVKRDGREITLSSLIRYPKDMKGPFALMIGTSHNSLPRQIFEGRPIALLDYNERQVNGYSQFKGDTIRTNYGFVTLYPELIDNGAYSEWIWGLSRIIDGLEIVGTERSHIDTKRIGVTGCSYAGKMALFCGAFDERVALTIAQEPGGGGAASWRVSRTLEGVEDLDHTDYHWFKESMREEFGGDKVFGMPIDHHELCAMVCPRALLVLGNTDYKWLADHSAYVSVNAARTVWQEYGIEDRMGYSILGGHPHCQLPEAQWPEVEAFIDRYLLMRNADTKEITKAPDFERKVALSPWINW